MSGKEGGVVAVNAEEGGPRSEGIEPLVGVDVIEPKFTDGHALARLVLMSSGTVSQPGGSVLLSMQRTGSKHWES